MRPDQSLARQVQAAQTDEQAADALIRQYLPFIRAETARATGRVPAQDEDALSIALFAFYESILAYRPAAGAFLPLAARNIRNRLIDYHRREQRHTGLVSLDAENDPADERTLGDRLADPAPPPGTAGEEAAAAQEIADFSASLAAYGITLSDVADSCPRQGRSMAACMQALDHARRTPALLEQLLRTRKLPLAQLADGAGVARKTLERHRKYLVAVLLAYTNGFEIIRGHLCLLQRKEAGL